MKKAKQILIKLLCFALVFVMGGGVIFSAFSLTASAQEVTFDIDTSSPLEDLKGAIVDGETFTLVDYKRSQKSGKQVLTLYEYGYSAESPEHFNLYFYVYSSENDKYWYGSMEAASAEFFVEMK